MLLNALELWPDIPEGNDYHAMTEQQLAVYVHDCAMLSLLAMDLPPQRAHHLKYLHFKDSQTECLYCQQGGCQGNYIDMECCTIVLKHHKNQRAWKGKAISLNLDPSSSLYKLLQHMHDWAWQLISTDDTKGCLFMSCHSFPLHTTFSNYFTGITQGIGLEAKITPQRLRSIFIDGLMSSQEQLSDLDLHGIAMAMGHSRRQWVGGLLFHVTLGVKKNPLTFPFPIL
jgi:hypothetical protein